MNEYELREVDAAVGESLVDLDVEDGSDVIVAGELVDAQDLARPRTTEGTPWAVTACVTRRVASESRANAGGRLGG